MTTLLQEIAASTAMKSPEHLKQWLRATGRQFIVLRADDLVDALPWPHGVDSLMLLIEAYRQERLTRIVEWAPCPRAAAHMGFGAHGICPMCKNQGQVPARTKDDRLESDEIDAAIAFLQGLKT